MVLDEVIVLLTREIKKWAGRRPVLLVSLITPLFWILLFGKSFNIMGIIETSVPSLNIPVSVAQSVVEALRDNIPDIRDQRLLYIHSVGHASRSRPIPGDVLRC